MGEPPNWKQLAAHAEDEAAAHALQPKNQHRVAFAIVSARERLGEGGVAGHTVSFDPKKWGSVREALPAHCVQSGQISRGDLFAIAADRDAPHVMWRLFVASHVWGYGLRGYGPSRLAKVERSTSQDQIEGLLGKALKSGIDRGPMAAYDVLRLEHPGPPAAKYWGPAFFTKTLYAGLRDQGGVRPALILDDVMGTQVTELSGLPHLLYRERGYNWSTYRYGVYIAWMGQTSERLDVSPELLEYSLFKM